MNGTSLRAAGTPERKRGDGDDENTRMDSCFICLDIGGYEYASYGAGSYSATSGIAPHDHDPRAGAGIRFERNGDGVRMDRSPGNMGGKI